MSLIGKLVKNVVGQVGDIAEDVVKSALIIPNQSVKSITGKDLIKGLTDTNTAAGAFLVGVNKVGIDSGHSALQSFANTVSGGYASKLHEKIVPGIVESQALELKSKTFESGILSKFENTSEKLAPIVGQLGASILSPKQEAAAPAAPASGIVKNLIKTETDQPVSLISKITSGFSDFSKSPVGQTAIGVLGNVVSNLATPKQQVPSLVPQQLALAAGNSPTIPNTQTAAQQAVFEAAGVTVSTKSGSLTTDSWWDRNKSWALPVALGIPGFFITLFLLFRVLFKRKR